MAPRTKYLEASHNGESGHWQFEFDPSRYFVKVRWVVIANGTRVVTIPERDEENAAILLAGWKFSKSKQWQRSWEAARG